MFEITHFIFRQLKINLKPDFSGKIRALCDKMNARSKGCFVAILDNTFLLK